MAANSSCLVLRDQIIDIDFSIPSETVTEIEFYNVQFIGYPTFSQQISKLTFEQCGFPEDFIVPFHEGLHTLRLGLQRPFRMDLPASLHTLHIRKMRFPTFPALPEGLKELRLTRVGGPLPPEFPDSLLKLTILECYWRTLPPFPSQLQFLLLDELELDTLPPIPPSVVSYREGEVVVRDRQGNRASHEEVNSR
jgi:hypothetical protein